MKPSSLEALECATHHRHNLLEVVSVAGSPLLDALKGVEDPLAWLLGQPRRDGVHSVVEGFGTGSDDDELQVREETASGVEQAARKEGADVRHRAGGPVSGRDEMVSAYAAIV